MGLSDILNSFEGQQALGLLAAAGGRSDGAGFGQRMLEGLGQGEKWKQQQQQQLLQKIQMDNYLSEIEQRKAATAKALQNQKIIGDVFGGSNRQAMPESAFSLAQDGYGPAAPASARPTRTGGIGGLNIDDVTRLKMAGLDVMKEFEWANNPQKFEQGSTYKDRTTGQERFMPKIPEGMAPNGQGAVGPVNGYLEGIGAIEEAKTVATEKGKSQFDIIDVPTGNGNQTVKMSRAQYLQQQGGGQPAQAGQVPGIGLDMSRVSPDQLKMMANEDPQALQRGMQRFQGGQSQPSPKPFGSSFGMTEDPQLTDDRKLEQERKTTLTKESSQAGVKRIYDGYDSARNAAEALTTLSESRKAIAGGSYGGTGAELKLSLAKGLQAFGISVDPEKVTNTDYLQSTVGEGILAKAKTLGANPTDNDARIIRSIVGSIGTDPQALNKLLDKQEEIFSRSIDSHNKNYQSAMKGGFSSPYDLTIERPKIEQQTKSTAATNIPREAINMLKMNPRLRADFEAKYGPGSASTALGQ